MELEIDISKELIDVTGQNRHESHDKEGGVMILPVCTKCPHGSIRDYQSHCSKEKCYSYLTKCIADKALDTYLSGINVGELNHQRRSYASS